jgi:peptide/nickel transport system substrate-binding protein
MKKKSKLFLTLLICCLMVVGVAACNGDNGGQPANGGGQPANGGGDATTPAAPSRDTLNVALTQDRGTLDPMYNVGWDFQHALRMIYQPLWHFDADANQVWVLATGITYHEPTRWHVHIREGVTFASGDPLTAEDVLFSFWRGNNRAGEPPFVSQLNLDLSSVIDDYTVELVFDEFSIAIEPGLAGLFMFHRDTFDEDTVATTTNGTGPFRVEEHVINSHFFLTARDDFWGDPPQIRNIRFRILAEDAQRVNALQTATVDIAGVPFQDIQFVQTLNDINVLIRPTAVSRVIYMNIHPRSPFHNNTDARRAVAYSIDRQAIVDIAYNGFASVSRLPVSIDNIDIEDRFLDHGVYGTGQNLERARELAISSGLVDQEILFINNGTSDMVVVAELVQANLREIGVTANIWTLDTGSWLGVVFDEEAWDMAVDFTSAPNRTYASNSVSWARFHAGGAYTRYYWPGGEEYLAYAAVMNSTVDPAERGRMLMRMTEILVDSMIWYSTADLQQAIAYSVDIANFHTLMGGNIIYYNLRFR